MNSNLLLTSCLENLREQYDVVAAIDCNTNSAELYNRIKSAHKEAYSDNERIVLHYTIDNHTLQNIQTIVNDIDISNFFVVVVTTDPDANSKYSRIHANNIDPVPLTIYIVNGAFEVNVMEDPVTKTDLTALSNLNNSLYNNKERELLFQSKHFCMAPWVHLQVDTRGSARLCCASSDKVGNTKTHSLNEIMMSNKMSEIRTKMLNDEPIDACNRCYSEEKLGRSSYRAMFNHKFGHHIKKLTPSFAYWDFRFNNLCNLACRSCGPGSSTSWYKPAAVVGREIDGTPVTEDTLRLFSIDSDKNNKKTYQQLLEHIDEVEEIYFAGGEPLIMPEHYEVLDELIARGKTDVRLMYNTNLTELTFKGRSVLDIWNEFTNEVLVCGSLDAAGDRGEYLRQGLNWNTVLKNIRAIKDSCPNVSFWVSATTGMINALHVPDLHLELVEKGLIKPADFNVQNIYSPEFMRVDRATTELREQIIERYEAHISWLIENDPLGRATQGFRSVINYLDNLKGFDKDLFWSNIQPLDEYYGVNLLDVFPELDILPKP